MTAKNDWTVLYGTPGAEVFEAHVLALKPEDAAWQVARDLPKDSIEDAPGMYTLLEVRRTNP